MDIDGNGQPAVPRGAVSHTAKKGRKKGREKHERKLYIRIVCQLERRTISDVVWRMNMYHAIGVNEMQQTHFQLTNAKSGVTVKAVSCGAQGHTKVLKFAVACGTIAA